MSEAADVEVCTFWSGLNSPSLLWLELDSVFFRVGEEPLASAYSLALWLDETLETLVLVLFLPLPEDYSGDLRLILSFCGASVFA